MPEFNALPDETAPTGVDELLIKDKETSTFKKVAKDVVLANQPISNITGLQTALDSIDGDITALQVPKSITTSDRFLDIQEDLTIVDAQVTISDALLTGAATGFSKATGQKDMLIVNNLGRPKFSTTAYSMKLRYGPATDLTGLSEARVRVWRKSGSTYNLVTESENFITTFLSQHSPNGTFVYTFTSPLKDIERGDYIALRFDGTHATITSMLLNVAGAANSCRVFTTLGATTTSVDFEAQSGFPSFPSVQLFGNPPWADYVSGSYGIGQDNVSTYSGFLTDGVNTIDTTRMIPFLLQAKLNRSICNMSQGGLGTVQDILDNFDLKIANVKAKVLFLIFGSNDASQGTTVSDFSTKATQIFSQVNALGIKIITAAIPPRTSLTEAQQLNVIEFNKTLKNLAFQYNGLYMDYTAIGLGQRRAGIARYNNWDILSTYNAGDNIHYTLTGYTAMSDALFNLVTQQKVPVIV